MVKGFKHVTDVERQLVLNMKQEGLSFTQIRRITGRSSETVSKLMNPTKGVKKAAPKARPGSCSRRTSPSC